MCTGKSNTLVNDLISYNTNQDKFNFELMS